MSAPSNRGGPEESADDSTELAPLVLLAHAEFLVAHTDDSALGRVHARRAVSAAYYAVFHRMTAYIAQVAAPSVSDGDRHELCRSFSHSGARKVARWIQRDGAAPERSEPLVRSAISPAMDIYVNRFGQLQLSRHDADYDHRVIVDRSAAVIAVRYAREAIEALDAAWDEPGWTSFCTLMLMHGTGKTG